MLIENCFISTGDDAVAVKSGMDAAGVAYGKPTRNVVVRNLVVGRTHALSIGSEMSGGVANVLFQVTLLYQVQAGRLYVDNRTAPEGCSCILESEVACTLHF